MKPRTSGLTPPPIPSPPVSAPPETAADVDAVCARLRSEIVELSWSDLARFAEVVSAIARAADRSRAASPTRNAAETAPPLPEDLRRRLLFACDIIFDESVLPRVRSFVTRNLGTGGLLTFLG